ncbi:hypothetical protein BKA70DRAFT_1447747 [Coprinopsis sp. MPI-PUGE-AT-0042]|nr:hypothetical protein BKA70DRAFT_1447747 [Coprinopsis sp. MPI-PUGE-AT-0042]
MEVLHEEKVVRLEAEVEAGQLERKDWASKGHEQQQHTKPSQNSVSHMTNSPKNTGQPPPPAPATYIRALKAEVCAAKEDVRRKDSRVMLVEREVGYLQVLLASFKAEEAYSYNTRMTTTLAVDQVKVDKMGHLEGLRAEHKNVNDQLANDLEALDGPMGSTDELEKVEQERKVLRQTISESGSVRPTLIGRLWSTPVLHPFY